MHYSRITQRDGHAQIPLRLHLCKIYLLPLIDLHSSISKSARITHHSSLMIKYVRTFGGIAMN